MAPVYNRSLIVSGCIIVTLFFLLVGSHKQTLTSVYHSAAEQGQGVKHEKLAYATFLAGTQADLDNLKVTEENLQDDKYFTAARLLGYYLMHKPSTKTRNGIPFIVLVTKSVPEIQINRLRRDGATVISVESEPVGEWFKPENPRFNDVMTKLRLWELTQYDRILFLDGDTALFKPLDGVFADPGSRIINIVKDPKSPLDSQNESPIPDQYLFATNLEAKGAHNYPPDQFRNFFNAGFFMISPSLLIHDHYCSLTNVTNVKDMKFKSDYPEQNMLNYAHRKDGPMPWVNLGLTWNVYRPRKGDVEGGIASGHVKWWRGADLKDVLPTEVTRMAGFYEGREEILREIENGVQISVGRKAKRWLKRQVFEWSE